MKEIWNLIVIDEVISIKNDHVIYINSIEVN